MSEERTATIAEVTEPSFNVQPVELDEELQQKSLSEQLDILQDRVVDIKNRLLFEAVEEEYKKEQTKAKKAEYAREYRANNLEAVRRRERRYVLRKRRENPSYAMAVRMRNRLGHIVRSTAMRSRSVEDMCGCTQEELIAHLESTMDETMDWGNLGRANADENGRFIEIDHIIPVSLFDLTTKNGRKECFHYTNLQLLYSYDNKVKGDSLRHYKERVS